MMIPNEKKKLLKKIKPPKNIVLSIFEFSQQFYVNNMKGISDVKLACIIKYEGLFH